MGPYTTQLGLPGSLRAGVTLLSRRSEEDEEKDHIWIHAGEGATAGERGS